MQKSNLIETIEVGRWSDIVELYDKFFVSNQRLAFRGQSNANWELKTSLERAAERLSIKFNELPIIEKGLIRKFQREAFLYIEHPPADSDVMQWLALMQHYGAPTRLLDWTYSFFIAVYFAFEGVRPGSQCSVWAIDYDWLRAQGYALIPDDKRQLLNNDRDLKKPETIDMLINSSPPIRDIYRLNPFRLNQRLTLQQGVFLVPGDISQSFMANLKELFDESDANNYLTKVVICADISLLREAILYLHRMNINRATLFPGLDGFAKSLCNLNVIPEAVVSDGLITDREESS